MANRHLSRSIVLQTLFEWDFKVYPDLDPEKILPRIIEEFGPGLNDSDFISNLLNGIIDKKETIDQVIEKAAPDWPINKISIAPI